MQVQRKRRAQQRPQAVLDRGGLDHLDQVDRRIDNNLLLAGGYLSTAFGWQTA